LQKAAAPAQIESSTIFGSGIALDDTMIDCSISARDKD
jgi:hypothetical protein